MRLPVWKWLLERAIISVPLVILVAYMFTDDERLFVALMVVGPVAIVVGQVCVLKWELPRLVGVLRDDLPTSVEGAARGLGSARDSARIALLRRRFHSVSWPIIGLHLYEHGLVIDVVLGPKVGIRGDQIRATRRRRGWFDFAYVEIEHDCPSIRSPLLVGIGPLAKKRIVPLLLQFGVERAPGGS